MTIICKIIMLTVCCIFLQYAAAGQPIDASMSTENSYPFVNEYMQMLRTDSMVSLDSVLQRSGDFVTLGDEPVIFWGYDPYYYWYRFSVFNPDSVDAELLFILGQLGIREAELFQKRNDQWAFHGRTGYSHPFESRPYLHSRYVYPISVAAHSTDTFYLSVDESHAYKTFAFALFHPKAMKKRENKFYFSFGIMVGFLLLFFIFNVYLYLSNREKIHFWYAAYILAQIYFLLKHEGLDAEFLGLDSTLGYRATSMASAGGLTVALLIHVIQLFIPNINSQNVLYKTVSFIKWLLFVMISVQWIVFLVEPAYQIEWVVVNLTNKTTFAGLLAILGYTSYSIYRGFKPGWLIFAGLAIFLFGGIERILFLTSKSYLLPPSLFEIGIVVETIVISFGLMYRYQFHERERKKIEGELQKQKVVQVKKVIGAQEEERKRIAEDLHDELGSNLAVIKLNLQSLESEDPQKSLLMQLIDDTSAQVRHVSHNLMPPDFANTPLENVVRAYIRQLNEDSAIEFSFYQNGHAGIFNKEEELMIYRTTMELTNNIIKHSGASAASVQYFYRKHHFEMIIEDNGGGFSDTPGDGIGLKNVRSRVQYLQGEISVDTSTSGTTVIISIPLKSRNHGG